MPARKSGTARSEELAKLAPENEEFYANFWQTKNMSQSAYLL